MSIACLFNSKHMPPAPIDSIHGTRKCNSGNFCNFCNYIFYLWQIKVVRSRQNLGKMTFWRFLSLFAPSIPSLGLTLGPSHFQANCQVRVGGTSKQPPQSWRSTLLMCPSKRGLATGRCASPRPLRFPTARNSQAPLMYAGFLR